MIELLTKEDIREVLRQELPGILAALLPHKEEEPVDLATISTYLGLSPQTITRYRIQGKIPYIKVGKSYRYIKSDVVKALTKYGLI
jgi:excisionase family DNA binding protein